MAAYSSGKPNLVTAYIALGSNLGDRRVFLDRALTALRSHSTIVVARVSSYHETAPVGGPPGQGPYLNAAAELHTSLDAEALLRILLEVEADLGRVRSERDGPRTIDLDLLLYSDLICSKPQLVLPHPRMHERRFVLAPLAEIASEAIHPTLDLSIGQLARRLDQADRLADAENQGRASEIHSGSTLAGRELLGLRAVVTGATRGIGQAIALELARAGADIIVHGRNARAAEETVGSIQDAQVRCKSFLADLSAPNSWEKLVIDAWDTWGGIDVWINNAGADVLTGEASRWSFSQKLEKLWAVDVSATIGLSRSVGRRMKAAGAGVILNVGWDQAETGMAGESGELFAATKGAIMSFSKSLALSLAPQVRVSCLAPGWIRTAWGEGASDVWQKRVIQETPLERWGLPQDVASTVRWLVSPMASYLTGQVIRINGGAVR